MTNFWSLFGLTESNESSRRSELGSLFKELNGLLKSHTESEVAFLAGFSGLLARVALSDGDLSTTELNAIRHILKSNSDLDDKLFESLLSLLMRHAKSLKGLEDHKYIQIVNQEATKKQKIDIVRSLFAVAAADDSIEFDEDQELALISNGLFLTEKEYSNIRASFGDTLEVLK